MKKVVFCLLIALQYCNAQIVDSLNLGTKIEMNNSSFEQFNNLEKSIVFHPISYNIKMDSRQYFSIYNKSSKLNDTYMLEDNKFIYKNSVYIYENNFRAMKKDSFNPGGARNLGSFLLNGFFNLLFN
jgi:hypothetical protein